MNLVNRGLARMKNDGKFTTFKYHRRAMYDYLWFVDTDLMECRGHVYDSVTKELVQAAPRKSFNYLENDYWWYRGLHELTRHYVAKFKHTKFIHKSFVLWN